MQQSYSNARWPVLMEQVGVFLFAQRNFIFTVGLILGLIGLQPVPFLGSWRADRYLDALGFGVTLAGQGVRILVIGYAQIHSGGTRRRFAALSLVTNGLLNHVRNPLYLSNILLITGLTLIHNNPWLYALGIPFTVCSYLAIVAAEEKYLEQRFGEEYREYCRRVPRWIPRLRGLRGSLHEIPFDGRRVLLREYGSIWIAVALPLSLMIYEELLQPPSPGRDVQLRVLGASLAVITCVWACLFAIKRRYLAEYKATVSRAAGPNPGSPAEESGPGHRQE